MAALWHTAPELDTRDVVSKILEFIKDKCHAPLSSGAAIMVKCISQAPVILFWWFS